MIQIKRLLFFGVVFVSSIGLVLSGGLWAAADAADPCVAAGKLTKEITSEAELAELNCFFKKWGGSETLHFKVGVKNKSNQPQRFKVNLFLDNGKAVGGLIPRKTKKGLVKPGATASFVYPVAGMAAKPGELMLIIKTISQ